MKDHANRKYQVEMKGIKKYWIVSIFEDETSNQF